MAAAVVQLVPALGRWTHIAAVAGRRSGFLNGERPIDPSVTGRSARA